MEVLKTQLVPSLLQNSDEEMKTLLCLSLLQCSDGSTEDIFVSNPFTGHVKTCWSQFLQCYDEGTDDTIGVSFLERSVLA